MFDIKGILDPIVAIINKVIPDKGAADAAAYQLQLAVAHGTIQAELLQLQAVTTAQSDVDKVEAANPSLFVAGARPFIMWIGGFALAYVSIVEPLARFISKVGFSYTGDFPAIDTTLTMQVLLGVLGLGAMRSYDKIKGVGTSAIGN